MKNGERVRSEETTNQSPLPATCYRSRRLPCPSGWKPPPRLVLKAQSIIAPSKGAARPSGITENLVFRVLKAHPIEFAQYLRSMGCAFSTWIFVILENPNESSFGLRIGLIWVVPLAQVGRSQRDQTIQHRVEPKATPCEPHPTITESCKDSTTAPTQHNSKNPRQKHSQTPTT